MNCRLQLLRRYPVRGGFLSTGSAVKKIVKNYRALSQLSGGGDDAAAASRKDHRDADHHEQTHFGYQSVPKSEKESMVGSVFRNVADQYDLMNDLMSGGVHRCWKQHFMEVLSPAEDTKLLDVAGGTGDIAFRFIDSVRKRSYLGESRYTAKVTVLDINDEMLRVGQDRAIKRGYAGPEIEWICANAEQLPLPDNTFDAYTISFGIRNCTNIDRVLAEAYRVLKPGGRFLCLEFGHVENPVVRSAYDVFSFDVIPVIGQLVANDRASYQYLVESIRRFPAQPVFAEMIRDAGFQQVEWQDLTMGVAAIHSGWKLPQKQ